ncbi:hypothetical protein BN59_02421 [Legionella massiliensis]|uniref:Uncharacterized protein n=1 Tax=Legionella massiliensis TaxID=1034943 RepID=A0A078L230_9GAMM|nr:hypothetical protein BN59_02421 [Legionella massiliensis]CEE13852.1 hypothetical protein BN1094_02421 [Legionella massiliensis]
MFGMTRSLSMFAPKGLGAPKDVRHVERRETSPECSTVLIPEIPHYVRDDEVFIDVCPKGAGRSRRRTSCRTQRDIS